MAKIGFIGLGLMGAAMVERLQSKDHDLTIIANRSRKPIDEAVSRGASEVKTAKELAEASDIIMLCVDTSDNVEARVLGNDGVLAGVSEGKIIIDFGTSRPASTRMLAEKAAGQGVAYLDAPLGRTPAHAKEGKLNIMCAGDKAAYEKVTPVLNDLGENVFHLGASGSGHTIKLINNFFAMTTAAAMSEAFAAADAAGIDRDKLYNVMSAGPLKSGMMNFVRNYAADGKIDLAFSIANGHKDVGYYRAMVEDLGAKSRMSTAAYDTLGEALSDKWGDRMVPELVDYLSGKLSQK